jgi:hypothetical protein
MSTIHTFQYQASAEFGKEIEDAAAKLNLSVPAYIKYLQSRLKPGSDAGRLDRHVREVFGKQGDLMRRLAK